MIEKFKHSNYQKSIAEKCASMLDFIKNEFDPPLTDEEVAVVLVPENWEFYGDKDDEVGEEKLFNCEPLDDQLRAYVYTDEKETYIKNIEIQGE